MDGNFVSELHISFFTVLSCDQAALRTHLSVRLSVRLSVCHTFVTMFLSSYHHEIFRSYRHWQKWCPCKGQGQRSKVKVKEVKTNFAPIWAFPDCNSSLNSKMTTKCHGKLNKVSTIYLVKYGQCYWYVTIIFQIDLGFQKRCRTGSGISRLQ